MATSAVVERAKRDGLTESDVRLLPELLGIPNMFVFRYGPSGTIIAAVNAPQSVALILQRSEPPLQPDPRAQVREFFDGLCTNTPALREAHRPLPSYSVEWLEGNFFLLQGEDRSTIAWTQWSRDGNILGLTPGYGFGRAERIRAVEQLLFERLPVDSSCRVVWGGRSLENNAHVYHRSQRYGVDLGPCGIMDRDASNIGIMAPISGVVQAAVDGFPDNRVYQQLLRVEHPFGNHVIVTNSHYSVVLAHLRQGSVCVVKGNKIKAGDSVGILGNSGDSSLPHLHVHAQENLPPHHGVPVMFPIYQDFVEPIRNMIIPVESLAR